MDGMEGPCVYCRRLRPPSKEHVLQRGLGGDLTTTSQETKRPTVCSDCNNGFSIIDQSLAEQSFIAFSRAAFTGASAPVQLGGQHFHYDAEHDLWLDVKLVNRLTAHILPQFHFRGGRVVYQGSDVSEKDKFLDAIARRHAKRTLETVYIKVGPSEHCSTPRLVFQRGNSMFVRAPTAEQGRQVLCGLDAQWATFEPQFRGAAYSSMTIERPSVAVNMPIVLDDNYRAVAKVAFNYLASTKGADFALRPEFDAVREYIRGNDLVYAPNPDPNEPLYDARFVRALPFSETPIVPTEAHLILLSYRRPRLWGLVTLYKNWSFVVRLGELELNDEVLGAHEFSAERTGNRPIDLDELFQRMRSATINQP